jgi:hypothetical protein
MQGVFWLDGFGVFKLFEGSVDVAWYGDVYSAVGVVPIKGDAY